MFLDCFKEQKQNLQVRAKKIKRKLAGISESWVFFWGGVASRQDTWII